MKSLKYLRSYKKISNQHKNLLKSSRKGKDPANCSMAPIGNKQIMVAVPHSMQINDAGNRVANIARLWKEYTIIPVSMPRVAA